MFYSEIVRNFVIAQIDFNKFLATLYLFDIGYLVVLQLAVFDIEKLLDAIQIGQLFEGYSQLFLFL